MISVTNIGKIGLIVCFLFISSGTFAQSKATSKTIKNRVAEASCGQCQFGMKNKKGCDLAVRFDGASYFVERVKIDEYGDAHAKDGFCNAVRKAKVSGKVVKDKFVAKSFELLPETAK